MGGARLSSLNLRRASLSVKVNTIAGNQVDCLLGRSVANCHLASATTILFSNINSLLYGGTTFPELLPVEALQRNKQTWTKLLQPRPSQLKISLSWAMRLLLRPYNCQLPLELAQMKLPSTTAKSDSGASRRKRKSAMPTSSS